MQASHGASGADYIDRNSCGRSGGAARARSEQRGRRLHSRSVISRHSSSKTHRYVRWRYNWRPDTDGAQLQLGISIIHRYRLAASAASRRSSTTDCGAPVRLQAAKSSRHRGRHTGNLPNVDDASSRVSARNPAMGPASRLAEVEHRCRRPGGNGGRRTEQGRHVACPTNILAQVTSRLVLRRASSAGRFVGGLRMTSVFRLRRR